MNNFFFNFDIEPILNEEIFFYTNRTSNVAESETGCPATGCEMTCEARNAQITVIIS